MSRNQIQTLFVGLLILLVAASACAGSPTSPTPTLPPPAPTSPIPAAERIAQVFIAAEETKQAVDYLALFSDDALFMDNSNATMRERGPDLVRLSQGFILHLFQQESWRIKFSSHFISHDGHYIALSGTWTDTGKDGNPASVPILIILEVKDGKIIRQDDYYDSSPFY